MSRIILIFTLLSITSHAFSQCIPNKEASKEDYESFRIFLTKNRVTDVYKNAVLSDVFKSYSGKESSSNVWFQANEKPNITSENICFLKRHEFKKTKSDGWEKKDIIAPNGFSLSHLELVSYVKDSKECTNQKPDTDFIIASGVPDYLVRKIFESYKYIYSKLPNEYRNKDYKLQSISFSQRQPYAGAESMLVLTFFGDYFCSNGLTLFFTENNGELVFVDNGEIWY